MRLLGILLLLASLLTGCVAPGSAHGHVSLRGSLESDAGVPLRDREVSIMLPAEYGLGGFDGRFGGKPETFGQRDERFSVVTDENGEFLLDLGDRHYHITYCLLPPLGAFPRNPPPPFFLLRVPSIPGESYWVLAKDDQVRILGEGDKRVPLSLSHLASLSAHSEHEQPDGKRGTVGVVDLRFHLP